VLMRMKFERFCVMITLVVIMVLRIATIFFSLSHFAWIASRENSLQSTICMAEIGKHRNRVCMRNSNRHQLAENH
jgi:CBS domain containing-hemolysin-like protein